MKVISRNPGVCSKDMITQVTVFVRKTNLYLKYLLRENGPIFYTPSNLQTLGLPEYGAIPIGVNEMIVVYKFVVHSIPT